MATGTDIYNKAFTKKDQRYFEGQLVPKDSPDWNGPWDCAELASWALYQVAGFLYGCTNDKAKPSKADAYSGGWAKDVRNKGIEISIDEAAGTKGAVLVRDPDKHKDGGHVAISDGNGHTIEAMGAQWGVTIGEINGRRWDYGVLVPDIIYDTLNSHPYKVPTTIIYRLTKPKMQSPGIKIIQQALVDAGYDLEVDGIFGEFTRKAVISFQTAKGLITDGELGPQTASVLEVEIQ